MPIVVPFPAHNRNALKKGPMVSAIPKPLLSLLARSKRARDVLWTLHSAAGRIWWAIEEADTVARTREAEAKRSAAARVQEDLETFRGLFELAAAERLTGLFVPGNRAPTDAKAN